ncbi:MAG TPA: FmdB family transcriptional regulator [Chloroflexi bacterium]|jgi:putative FmdB family regulatory protein|nr:FmdB family transcriptional regulator [Chloroflexota bacterium]HAF18346.1 FmdB family transcriptional regulator [Chloroflexota bacterium]
MPIYGYRCSNCGHEFEIQQRMSDQPLKACPKCHGKLNKILYPVGISFKGSGFYTTDYGSGKSAAAASSNGAAKGSDKAAAESSSDSKAESSSESKSESKPKSEPKPDTKSTSKSDSKTERKAS